ncbi:MAG: hypothetical protein Q8N30_04030 [Methylococcales bacterium]|nr:hypothetical protein [Methylococcales bacterium]
MAEQNEVNVEVLDSGFAVKFPYDRELVNKINKVPGAKFDKDAESWIIPKDSEEALDKVIETMHFDVKAIAKDRESIMELAKASASDRMKDYGTEAGISAQISDFHKEGGNHSGEILNVNGRYAAQLTGFGKDNGAAFVSIHRVADLSEPVYKGDDVRIKYNNNGIGEVFDRRQVKSADEIAKDFDAALGNSVDGIKVVQAGDKYQVSFDYNPDIQHRLQRIADVEFNKDAGAWEVPLTHKEFVIKAVSDMRKEFSSDLNERYTLGLVAEQKLDGAKVRDAFTKDGLAHYGNVIDVSERYVLQHGGQNEFKLHRKSALDQPVKEGQNLKITYEKGRGAVQDRKQEKDKSIGMER